MTPSGHMAPPEISAIGCCHLFDTVDTSTSAHAQTVKNMEAAAVKLIVCTVEDQIFHPHLI